MAGSVRRLGNVQFDGAAGTVTVEGEAIELDRSCRAILSLLLSQVDEPISKDRLLEAGWPGRVVHENSLTKAIARLRQALGKEGKRIEAIYGQGYRLAGDDESSAPLARPPMRWRPLRYRVLTVLVGVVLVVLIVLAMAFWTGGNAASDQSALKIGEAPDVIGRVLWVDDHPGNNAEERRFLEGRRIAVYDVTSSDDAMKLLSMYKYDAVISDMGRNGNPLAGLELVKEMRARKNYTPFVLYTILPSKAQRDLLAEYGGQGVAVTPEGLYSFLLPGLDRRSARRAAD
jgi:DNA-binding response OmpR family regulator